MIRNVSSKLPFGSWLFVCLNVQKLQMCRCQNVQSLFVKMLQCQNDKSSHCVYVTLCLCQTEYKHFTMSLRQIMLEIKYMTSSIAYKSLYW